jgi:hypothetical protein
MISVRRSVYRNKNGFIVTGRDDQGRHISIFAETYEVAQHIADKVRRGEQTTVADFQPPAQRADAYLARVLPTLNPDRVAQPRRVVLTDLFADSAASAARGA